MALTPADLRILIKRSTNTGEVPTAAPSTDHTDGTWDALDIYKGELFINVADDKLWMRTDSGIVQLYPSAGGITSLNGLTASTQTFAVGTSGTDFTVSSVTSTHTFNLPTASASARGALSSSDWTTFNNKIGGSLTSGRVPYASGTSTLTDTSLFVFDGTKLGVGLTTPTATIHSKGSDSTSSNFALKVDNSSSSAVLYARNDIRVGVGTSSPSGTLHIVPNSTDDSLIVKAASNVDAMYVKNDGAIGFGYSDNYQGTYYFWNRAGVVDTNNNVYIEGTNCQNGLTINNGYKSGGSGRALNIIQSNAAGRTAYGIYNTLTAGGTDNYGIYLDVRAGSSNTKGIEGYVTVATGGSQYGIDLYVGNYAGTSYVFKANSYTITDNSTLYGYHASLTGKTSPTNVTQIAGYFRAVNGSTNYAIVTDGGNSGFGTTTPTAFVHIAAGTTSAAQLRLAAGVAPSSPNDGDIYYVDTNDRLMFRKNTLDSEILSASAVTTETVVSDTTLTITYNGTTYKLLAKA